MSAVAQRIVDDPANEIFFSVVSIWEIAIKHSKGRADFQTAPGAFRELLLQLGNHELPIHGEHAAAVAALPPLHKDPFDRMLIAQSMIEGIVLLTADAQIARYGGLVQRV